MAEDKEKTKEQLSQELEMSEKERKRLEYDLGERAKELNCIYGMADIAEKPGITLDEIYAEMANLLPPSWQYPEVTCVRITINDKEFKTKNWRDTAWKQSSDIKIGDTKAGSVEVGYLEERPEIDEVPFLKEERLLIDAVAERLGRITERKQTEEKLEKAAQEWRTTFDSITDLISLNDKDFRLIRVNKAFADAVKMKPVELIGKPCYEIVHGTNEPVPNCPHKKSIKTKKPATGEFFEPHLGIDLEVSVSPILNEEGEVGSTVHIIRDISERKRAEQQLEEYLSYITHELRTPLTAIIASGSLLSEELEGAAQEPWRKLIKNIMHSAHIVEAGLSELQDLAKARVGSLKLNSELLDIKTLLRDVETQIRPIAQRKQQSLTLDLLGSLPPVKADPQRLEQVLLNLLSNAIKFTPEDGSITLRAKKTDADLVIEVQDTGRGIPEDKQARLFEAYYRVDKQHPAGMGLGLTLSKQLIELHGGRIWVESEVGRGSTFAFSLPLEDAQRSVSMVK